MSLVSIVDSNTLSCIKIRHREQYEVFKNSSQVEKAKVAEQIFLRDKVYQDLGCAAVRIIDKQADKIENLQAENDVLTTELKDAKIFDPVKVKNLVQQKIDSSVEPTNKDRMKNLFADELVNFYKIK